MKTLILILGCLLLVIPCQAAEKQPEHQKKELEEVEKYISRHRRGIENYYNGQLFELKLRAQSEIRLLEVADKAVYASLAAQAEVAKVVLHIDDYGYRAPRYLVAKTERMLQLKGDESYSVFEDSIKESPKRFTMAHSWRSDVNSLDYFTFAQSWTDDGDFADIIKKSSKRFAVAHSQIAERKNRILAKLGWETVTLEQRKRYALTDGLAQFEKRLKEDVLKPKPKATRGVVTGVLYSMYKPSAIVDHKIVHEGDTIHGVTVVKIYKDKVKFSKKGKYWEQEVRQTPEAYWK